MTKLFVSFYYDLLYNTQQYTPHHPTNWLRFSISQDPNAPPGAVSAYMWFCKEWRPQIVSQNPSESFGNIGKLLGVKWANLSDTEKKPFTMLAAEDKKRYAQDVIIFEDFLKEQHGEENDEIVENDSDSESEMDTTLVIEESIINDADYEMTETKKKPAINSTKTEVTNFAEAKQQMSEYSDSTPSFSFPKAANVVATPPCNEAQSISQRQGKKSKKRAVPNSFPSTSRKISINQDSDANSMKKAHKKTKKKFSPPVKT